MSFTISKTSSNGDGNFDIVILTFEGNKSLYKFQTSIDCSGVNSSLGRLDIITKTSSAISEACCTTLKCPWWGGLNLPGYKATIGVDDSNNSCTICWPTFSKVSPNLYS